MVGKEISEPTTGTEQRGNNVTKIALTGGPCAGKTTSLKRLSDYLTGKGVRVFLVPEAATMFFSSGMTVADLNTEEDVLVFQTTLLQTQIHLENSFFALASRCGEPAVLLCDRGAMDGRAYMTPEMWSKLLTHNNLDEKMLRDERYNLVLHMITAADGAEPFYTLENNHTRTETVPEAITLDRKTLECWKGHSNLHVFDNTTTFEGKIQRVLDCVYSNLTSSTPEATSPHSKALLDIAVSYKRNSLSTKTVDPEQVDGPSSPAKKIRVDSD